MGAPSDAVFRDLDAPADARHAAVRLAVPAPTVRPGAWGVRVDLPGFLHLERAPGLPDLPTRTVLFALPPGAEPELEVSVAGESVLPGILPDPVPRREGTFQDLPEGETLRALPSRLGAVRRIHEPSPEVYQGARPFPEAWAWIEEIGVLRDQRYAKVRVAPVRFDAALPGLRVAREVAVQVRFRGDPGLRAAPLSADPFEDVYRRTFLNYAQGTRFRLSALAPYRTAAAESPGVGTTVSGGDALAGSTSGVAASGTAATGPRYKIRIRENRVVRLDHTRMNGTGFLSEPLSTWKLTNRGVEVPLQVHDANLNDLMDPGDWVQFYGQALDDEPETVLNYDFANTTQDIYEMRDVSDTNVYFLVTETGARARMAERESAPTNTRTPPTDFEAAAHEEVEDAWRPLGSADPWYWLPTLSVTGTASRLDAVALPGLASGTSDLRVLVHVRGTSEDSGVDPDHRTKVTLENDTGNVLATDEATFDGRTLYLHDFTWTYPGSGPTASDPVQVQLETLSVAGLSNHSVILDYVEVRYRRSFQAQNDVLAFSWPDEDAEFEIGGFTNANIEVYETTGRVGGTGVVDAVRLTGGAVTGSGPYTVRFRVDNDPNLTDGTTRTFVAFAEGSEAVPPNADFIADTVSDLRDTTNQADLIVIAHPDVLDNSPGSPLDQLLSHRASQGVTSKVVLLEDVQDEFNDGLEGPLAIKNFLAWVMSTNPGEGWADPKPAYVLLLGDASYDTKAGTANGNFVPTQILFLDRPELGYFAGDNVLAAVVGSDQQADLVIGRIPGRSVADVNLVLQKILDYEQATPPGNWTRHALFVSDRGKKDASGDINANEALDFEATNDAGEAFMKIPPHTSRKLRYYSDYCDAATDVCDSFSIRQDIKDEINGVAAFDRDGAGIVQYVGHGNFEVWSDDAFFDERNPPPRDTDDLVNGVRLPWMLAHNCLTGGFHTTLDHSMGEDWLFRSGGGAVAVFSPTGLSFNFVGRTVTEVIWDDVFGAKKERNVAVPVMDTLAKLCGQGSIEPCEHYALLGDPTLQLVFPSVDPPTNVAATAGNAVVDLTWTASATPGATYDVYRSTDPERLGYSKVNTSAITGTAYTDTNVTNTVTYFYYVIALDAEGFESRWSNFNSDCDIDGPDCVKATPLNPNPPAPPTGVVVTDPEKGFRLDVSWDPNTESDLDHYTVHWGTQSGVYTDSQSAGRDTFFTITNLQNGVTYYVAVTATNTSGKTSDFSQEKTGVPTFVRGTKNPAFITDLQVDKSGTDLVLSWGAVTADIYGKAETVDHYEVYRDTVANFEPSSANLLATGLTTTSYTDAGAAAAGGPDYYYLVRAVDVDGNAGGAGRQLPAGVEDLLVDKSDVTPGNLVLSWSAVTTDFDGNPTLVDHYELYAADQPFSRADIRDGLVPVLTTTTGTSVELTPPSQDRYYSVLAVDNRGNKSPF